MIKLTVLAAAAALCAAPAMAQVVAPEVELEGTITDYTAATSTLTLMGMQVYIPPTATVHSPTTDRAGISYSLAAWFRGAVFPGRTPPGMLGGTGIVTGTWDAANNRIVADDVFTEPAENVSLGVITSNWCTTANCDGSGDYVRGNSAVGGAPGPAMIPLRDRRISAGPVRDETGFSLDLTGVSLRGEGYAAEGYFGASPVTVPNTSGGAVSERSFHYFILDLVNPSPHLFANKGSREVSVLRTRCNVGDRWEIRGHVHTTVNANGIDNDAINSNTGVLSVQYRNAAGQLVRVNGGAATAMPGFPAIGQFRIRFDTPFCPETYTLRWLPTANSNLPYASLENVGIDRLRADDPEDD